MIRFLFSFCRGRIELIVIKFDLCDTIILLPADGGIETMFWI